MAERKCWRLASPRSALAATLEFLVEERLWVALVAAALCDLAGVLLQRPRGWLAPLIVFSATLFIYQADRILDRRGEARAPGPLAHALGGGALIGLALFAGIAGTRTAEVLLAGTPCALAYAVPVRGRRLKDLARGKAVFVASGVTIGVLGTLLASTTRTPRGASVALTGALVFLLVLGNALLSDLRDVARDRACGRDSLPTRWGESGTVARVAGIALLLAAAATALGWSRGPVGISPRWGTACALGATALALATWAGRARRLPGWWRALAVDGALLLPWLAVAI